MRFAKLRKYYSIIIIIAISLLTLLNLAVFLYSRTFNLINYQAKSVLAAKMTINTDKTVYEAGETVEIEIINSATKTIAEENRAPIIANYERNLGKNFGVGVIEKYENNLWLVVEAIWRCNSPCYEECKYKDHIGPTESKIFSWSQELIMCDELKKKEEVKEAGAGKYRVSAAVYDENQKMHIIFHSNEFIIN